MVYLNKNVTLNQLKELVQKNINHKIEYMPDDFNNEQKNALKLFQKRIFLEEVIDETISFNKKINWDNTNKSLNLTTTAEELVNVFKLRSDVYTSINYQDEFPDTIEGLNFDKYDKYSAIIYYQTNNEMTGSIRLIFDKNKFLPSEKKYSFEYLRNKSNKIGELSRQIVKQNNKGLGLEFKNFYKGIYQICINNPDKINLVLASITQEHFKLYSKFGGITIEKKLNAYGNLNIPFLVLSWKPTQSSNYFKRIFLK